MLAIRHNTDMKIAILGYGEQGRSALEYWGPKNDLTICDNNPVNMPVNFAKQTGQGYLDDLERFDLIVRSPSIHPDDIVQANSEHVLRKVTTVTEEFFRVCPAPVIGVTGTKGKGTTSTLITKILEAAGKKVHLGGNIGIPPLDMLKNKIQPSDYVVLELANFQLIDLHFSPDIAVCLMVAPEHLDWHKSMEEYIRAKQQLFRYQTDDALAIFNRLSDFSTEVASVSPALKISYEVPALGQSPEEKNGSFVDGDTIYYDDVAVCSVNEVKLLGRHNLENVCAAISAVWKIVDGNKDAIIKTLRGFTGLPHRLELIRELNNVDYYDDSFGTTPDTAIVAIQAITKPKVLILGGSDKKADYSQLAVAIKESNVRKIVLIGQTAPAIKEALSKAGFNDIVDGGSNMRSIVSTAQSQAQRGDAVILSTACASFDMFKDYTERGNQFSGAVREL